MRASHLRSARRHRKHANPFSVRGPLAAPELASAFARAAPLALDVGFGEGGFLLALAQAHPEWNVLGLEIRPHLVEELNARAKAAGLGNAVAVLANANLHLHELVPDRSVAFVAVNFPDPWYKKRHQKRRVVNPEWLVGLEPKLVPGAELHAMSDYQPIAEQIRRTLEANPRFCNLDGAGTFAPASTTGIVTEREAKHQRRGEPIYRLRFTYRVPGGA